MTRRLAVPSMEVPADPFAGPDGSPFSSSLIDALALRACYVDAEKRYRYVSRAYREAMAWPAAGPYGARLPDVLGGDFYERISSHVEHALSGRAICFEVVGPLPGRTLRSTYTPDFGPDGSVRGFFGLIEDVTDRKRAEIALRESEDRYHTLFEENLSGNFVSTLDGTVTVCNPAFARMFGYSSADEAIGSDANALFPDPDVWARLVERLRTEKTVRLLKATLQDVDGNPVHVIGNFVGCFDAAGEMDRVLAYLLDVSEHRKAEEERDRLAMAVEQAAEAVTLTDPAGVILDVNPAFERITGYARDEVVGRTPNILKSGEHDDAFYRELWETIQGGEVWRGRLVNRRKDGEIYHAEGTISPLRDPSSEEITGFVQVQRDRTRELALEAELQHAHRLDSIGQLAGGIAHDFNNLLTVIMGSAEFALLDLPEDSACRREIEEIYNASDRAAGLTRQLLAVGRRSALQPRIVNLNEIIGDMEHMLRRIIGEDVELKISFATDLGKICIDPGQLERVLLNLVTNACHAMPEGGRLTIETKNVRVDGTFDGDAMEGMTPGSYALITVWDTGEGMDEATRVRIFEPFFSTKARGTGTGLGLATAYGIVKQSRGHIWVHSEVGVGTTFRIYLPLVGMGDEASTAAVVAHEPVRGGTEAGR